MANLDDKALDSLLEEVERHVGSLKKSANLSKAIPPKGDEPKMDAAPEAPVPEAAPSAPAPEAAPSEPAPEAPAPDSAAPEASEPAVADKGDGSVSEEAQELEEVSDEELQSIYESLPPEELERHYMILRSVLQKVYGGAEGQSPEAPAPEAAPSAPAPEAAPSEPAPGEIGKSEKIYAEIETLKKSNANLESELASTLEFIKAYIAKPQRKSADVEYVAKSEKTVETKKYSTDELKVKANAIAKSRDYGSLTKSERDSLSLFVSNGSQVEAVEKIISKFEK